MKIGLVIISLLLALPQLSQASQKIVVLDTGLDITDTRLSPKLCAEGHKDFTNTELKDTHGHGTHVVGLIEQYAKDTDYCLVIVKYYREEDDKIKNMKAYKEALTYAFSLEPKIINFSGSGPQFDEDELVLIKDHPNTILVTSAGNEKVNLDIEKRYPASYKEKNIIVVGSIDAVSTTKDAGKNKSSFSNYGKIVTHWEIGNLVLSTAPDGKQVYNSGTSMSSAIYTGKLIYTTREK